MDWSWLVFLMCPLMMIPMIFMMMKGNKHSDHTGHDHQKNLAMELEQLRNQNEQMQKELHDLKKNA